MDTRNTDERRAVSEEREGAAGDADNTTPGAQTAVVTRPLRPTGKRSRKAAVVAGSSETVEETEARLADGAATKGGATKEKTAAKAKTAKKRADRSLNPFLFVLTYLRQVYAELRKVIWPNRKQMVSYTSVVLVFLVFMTALIGGADQGLTHLMLWIFTGQWSPPHIPTIPTGR